MSFFVKSMRILLLLGVAVPTLAGETKGLEIPAVFKMTSAAPEQTGIFRGPDAGERNWRICVVLPNVSDKFWGELADGVRTEATRLGVTATIYIGSGYTPAGLRQQQKILNQRCTAGAMDAVLIAATDNSGLDESFEKLRAKGILIVDLMNGYISPLVDAHALLDNYHLGRLSGETIAEHLEFFRRDTPERELNFLWIPGPEMSDWVIRADQGFMEVFKDIAKIKIETFYWEPHYRVQARELRRLLAEGRQYDLIVGTAPTALAVTHLKNEKLLPEELPVFAYYASPDVYDLLQKGQIWNAVTNEPYLQGRIGVALAVGLLEKRPMPYQVGPVPKLLLSPEQTAKAPIR